MEEAFGGRSEDTVGAPGGATGPPQRGPPVRPRCHLGSHEGPPWGPWRGRGPGPAKRVCRCACVRVCVCVRECTSKRRSTT
eukprot:7844537-Pyramimonas_sp.AAC.1